jgi:uncharacterized protein
LNRRHFDASPSAQMSDSPTKKRLSDAEPAHTPERALRELGEAATGRSRGAGPAPSWNPPDCGDIDMRIAADGTWFYCGSPIRRLALVQIFASVLRKETDRYVLVTPVEKVGIRVDDAPFLAVEMRIEDKANEPRLIFRTNVEDLVTVDSEHLLRFERGAAEGLKPYVRVRGDLWALITRALVYDLVALGQTECIANQDWFGVRSCGVFFPMCHARAIEGF